MQTRSWILTLLLALAVTAGLSVGLLHGPRLLVIHSPDVESRVGLGGVELLVRFSPGHAQVGTFRALLNGADVTEQLRVASNGAHGSLHGLLEGQNELRLEIFGVGLVAGGSLRAREPHSPGAVPAAGSVEPGLKSNPG